MRPDFLEFQIEFSNQASRVFILAFIGSPNAVFVISICVCIAASTSGCA